MPISTIVPLIGVHIAEQALQCLREEKEKSASAWGFQRVFDLVIWSAAAACILGVYPTVRGLVWRYCE